jgi:hypothetical protein
MSGIDRGRLAEPTSMARQNKHLDGKPGGLSLSDLTMTAEPAAYLTSPTKTRSQASRGFRPCRTQLAGRIQAAGRSGWWHLRLGVRLASVRPTCRGHLEQVLVDPVPSVPCSSFGTVVGCR